MSADAVCLSSLFLAMLLIEQRVECLKITCGLVAEAVINWSSCVSEVSKIQFIKNKKRLSLKQSKDNLGSIKYINVFIKRDNYMQSFYLLPYPT